MILAAFAVSLSGCALFRHNSSKVETSSIEEPFENSNTEASEEPSENPSFETTSEQQSESLDNESSSAIDYGPIVEPLSEGDDYNVDEFEEVYANSAKNFGSSSPITYSEYTNFMPHEVYDKYGIGAHRVRVTTNDVDHYDYYLMYNHKIYDFSRIGARVDSNHYIVQFLFSDYNGDGFVEITVSYFCYSYLTYLSSFDTKNEMFVVAESAALNNAFITFERSENGFDIYKQEVVDGVIQEEKTLYSYILGYSRDYHLNEEMYKLKNSNYRVEITFDKYTTVFPFVYAGLKLKFAVHVSMHWLGEAFTYTNGTTYLDGALTTFRQNDHVLEMEGWDECYAITTFTIIRGQVIDKTYYYIDTSYDRHSINNPIGTYDMEVSYRGESLFQDDALTIESASLY